MIEDALLNYGMAGLFIIYLIYDRQVLMSKVILSLDSLNTTLKDMKNKGNIMENEKEETKTEETKGISIVDEARAIRDDIKKEKEELKAENDKKEKLQSEELLAGTAGGKVEAEPVKEETSKEYADKVMSGGK